jgi:manganese/zinc/iron transport system substrate-binding protein
MNKAFTFMITVFITIGAIMVIGTLLHCRKTTPTEKTSIRPAEAEPTESPPWGPVKEIPYNMVVSVDIIRELCFMFARTRSNKAVVLVKPGMNPLTYTPTEEDEKAILDADVFYYMGLGLEPGIEQLVERVKNKVRCIAITSGLDRNILIKSDKYPGGYDPHIWWGLDVWEKLLLNFTRKLVQVDPEGEYKYSTIYLRYGEATNHLNHRFYTLWMNAIPEERRFFITLHPAYTYFGRLYGFTVRSIIAPFEDDYSETRINELADFIISNKIPVIFPEAFYSRAPIEELKKAAAEKGYNVTIGPEIYSYFLSQDMSDRNYTYLNAVRVMGRSIYDALKIEDMPGVPD